MKRRKLTRRRERPAVVLASDFRTEDLERAEKARYRRPKRRARRGNPVPAPPLGVLVSAVILLLVIAIKIVDPEGASALAEKADELVGGEASLITVEAVGHALAGGGLPEIFSGLTEVFSGNTPEPEVSPIPELTPAPPEPSPAPVSPPPREYDVASRSLMYRVEPSPSPEPERVSEDELVFDDYGADDTLPLPYGMEAPDKADFTVYELPFDYVSPVEGVTSSGFGYRLHPLKNEELFHFGTDFAVVTGTPVLAFAGGTVVAGGSSATYGYYLMVRHAGDCATLYAHCSKLIAGIGDEVKAGQKIALSGNTGLSTGAHLHFELRRGGAYLNPESYLS